MNSRTSKQKCYTILIIDIYKKHLIHNDIQYIIKQKKFTYKNSKLSTIINIYKGMKIIITKNLYPKIGIVNGTYGYVQRISLIKSLWIQHDNLIHPPINIIIDFNEFI